MAEDQEEVERVRTLLENQHTFPGPFLFRVVVRPADSAVVVSAITCALDAKAVTSVTSKESRTGKYVSLNITTEVASADDVLSVYDVLKKTPEVVAAL